MMQQIDMSYWSNSVGAQVSSNTANIAIITTGKVDCTAFSGTI